MALRYALACYTGICALGLVVALASDESAWPSFYEQGEATAPTQSILDELREYESSWWRKQSEEGFGQSYSFVMRWGCSQRCGCLEANRFVRVVDGRVQSVETSQLNDASQLARCGGDGDGGAEVAQYKSIDELYALVIEWVESGIDEQDFLIIALRLHADYFFPMSVKLSEDSVYIAFDIICFAPGMAEEEEEEEVCQLDTGTHKEEDMASTFWISGNAQRWLGWSMVLLIVMACSLGYCINWLKKKKSKKIDAWREREEQEREERLAQEKARQHSQHSQHSQHRHKQQGKRYKSRSKDRAKDRHRHKDSRRQPPLDMDMDIDMDMDMDMDMDIAHDREHSEESADGVLEEHEEEQQRLNGGRHQH